MNKTVTSLAILKVNWDRFRKDYIESFIPFIATLIKNKDYKIIDVNTVCEDFKQEFGIIIPYYPMISILRRSQDRELIRRDGTNFVPNQEKVNKYDFSKVVHEQQDKQERVINGFVEFSKKNYNIDVPKNNAETAMLLFLKENDLNILFAAKNATVLPPANNTKSEKFLAYSFIKNCNELNSELFKFIIDIAIGHAVASILLYTDFEKYKGKFKGLNFFLDTRFILRLLGAEGNIFKKANEEFLKMLLTEGVKLYLFEHTYEEVQKILEDSLHWIESRKYNPGLASPTLKYFIQNNYTDSDVERFIVKVPEVLSANRIEKVQTPDPNILQDFQIDEKKLLEIIVDTYKEKNPFFSEWEKGDVLSKDIRSLSAIYKLRKGRNPRNIKDCGSIFVTTNAGLAFSSRKFQINERKEEYVVPACVTDIFIGTLMWLQSPEKMAIINERKIVAQCYAALQPDDELVKAYLEEVDKLLKGGQIDEEEYYLLRAHRVAMNLLKEMTLNDPNKLSDNTAEEILRSIKERIKVEAETKYRTEKDAHESTKELLKSKEVEKNKVQKEKKAIENNVEQFASVISLIIAYSFYIILIIVAFVGSLGQIFPKIFPKNGYLFTGSIIVTCMFSWIGIISDFNIKNNVINKFVSYLKAKIASLFIKVEKR